MSIVGFLRSQWVAALLWRKTRQALGSTARGSIPRAEWTQSLSNPTAFYLECFRFFHRELPLELRQHRAYFHNEASNRRGYGEDAFHTLWFLLFQEIRPQNFLEIGVFRGQVITLAALCTRYLGLRCEVAGISPFSSAGDSVTRYRSDIDYYQDTLSNFDHFSLPHPTLVKAYSTDPAAVRFIESKAWDLIYIDGNHDYDVVRKDWEVCSRSVRPGGVVVFDDSSLHTSYQPPVFASKGHPGPSRLVQEIDPTAFREVVRVGHNRAFQKIAKSQ